MLTKLDIVQSIKLTEKYLKAILYVYKVHLY